MRKPKHKFTLNTVVICDEIITIKNYREILKLCHDNKVFISDLIIQNPLSKDYIYFGWDGEKISRYYKTNDLQKVSWDKFVKYFGSKEKTLRFEITKETILKYNMKDEFPSVMEEQDAFFNKPLLSLNDLLSVWGDINEVELYKTAPLFKSFEQVAKSKAK